MIIGYSKRMVKDALAPVRRSLVRAAQRLMPAKRKSPDELLGELFHDVQARQVFVDGKTFVDLVPKKRVRQIVREYQLRKQDPHFDIHEFVTAHFYEFDTPTQNVSFTPASSARQHVTQLWPHLVRRAETSKGSLIALPYDYVVPGGRFAEQFYWDSYFIMLGLAADGEWMLLEGMMKNYAYMIQRFGFIPTANRSYFLSRSQPPFLAQMVRLLARHPRRRASLVYIEYLPSLLAEYAFWMKGRRKLKGEDAVAHRRVVKMQGGQVLNRYFDNKTTPRPESRREDLATAEKSRAVDAARVFLDLRAAAESGWDFSSRWFADETRIETIMTTDIVPIDLNCLLHELEVAIAHCYDVLKQPLLKRQFTSKAAARADAIRQYFWDDETGFFYDYNFRTGQLMSRATLAAAFPLYAGIATKAQAGRVAAMLERDFLRSGGLRTTLTHSGEQWDAPNGWAPLQWVAYVGLKRYGFDALAQEVRMRWMASTEKVFATHGKMIEKYDVESKSGLGGGGEYPLQDGFGWTNGVYAALHDELEV